MAIVGVIGSGTMGKGVAQHFAQYNHSVILVDISEDILQESIKHIEKSIRVSRLFSQRANLEAPEVIKNKNNNAFRRFKRCGFYCGKHIGGYRGKTMSVFKNRLDLYGKMYLHG